jgi:DNA-binding NarL/FixJ family response regulator
MNRLFVVADDASVEHATRFAQRCSSGVNLFAVTAPDGSIREAIREAKPDIAILVGIDHAETTARHVREVSDEAPSAVVLVLTARSDAEVLDEVCHAAAMACVAVASEHDLSALAGDPTGMPSNGHVNGNGTAAAAAAATWNQAAARDAAREQEKAIDMCRLTPRELDVLRAVAEGQSNAQIGRQLWVTEQTVKFHLSNIYRKLGVSNRTEAMRRAITRGLISGPGGVSDREPERTALAR